MHSLEASGGLMETTMSNSSEDKLTSSRELTADELNQVTGGMGPVLIFRGNTNGGNVAGGWALLDNQICF